MSARSGDVTTRNPALSSASLTLLRSDAQTSGAPEQRNSTAAFSGIVGLDAAGGCGAGRGATAPRALVARAGEDPPPLRAADSACIVAPFTAAAAAVGGIFDA